MPERIYPTKEEMEKIFKRSTERADKLSESKVEKKADEILNTLDLELSDLQGKEVLDLGFGPSYIERAAKSKDINSVTSLERIRGRLSQRPEVKGGVVGRTRELPLKKESIDLLISRAAPPIIIKTKKDAILELNEIERVLSKEGEARIGPTTLVSIELELFPPSVRELEKRGRKWILERTGTPLTEKKKELILTEQRKIQPQLVKASTEFLIESGYNISLNKNNLDEFDEEDPKKYYWILKKRVMEENS